MDLPVMPPVSPMLAKSVTSIPSDASYEPKWDGFRSILFRDGEHVEVGSRNEKPMTRYFPELVAAATAELPKRCVIDGEIVIATDHGLDFDALQQRIHPADSRVRMLADKTPASFIAFDLLALGDDDYTGRPFSERRAALVDALDGSGPSIHVTPATTDLTIAQRWFDEFEGAGLDGVVAKPLAAAYEQNARTMLKIKHERTADVVLAGYREHKTSTPQRPLVGSLLLGLYAGGELQHIGVSASFTEKRRAELVEELAPLVCPIAEHPWGAWAGDGEWAIANPDRMPGTQSRWSAGKDLSFTPLRPDRVLEVKYDHMEGRRFRHTAHFKRWRDDRDPTSCGYEQLEEPVSYDLATILTPPTP
jgi:ATP-dependent DNA ligase